MGTKSRKQAGVHKTIDCKGYGGTKEEYSVYSEFDLEQHKKTFMNYLEIVIEENGTIRYAVPSHQEMAIKLACEKNNWTRDQLNKNCPPEYYLDFLPWLLKQSNAICVWDNMYVGSANKAQKQALETLKNARLYKGEI